MRKKLFAAAIAATFVLAAAQPAFALKTATHSNTQQVTAGTIVQSTSLEVVNDVEGPAIHVAWQCQADTQGKIASALGFRECYLEGRDAGQRWEAADQGVALGVMFLQADAVVNAPRQPYRVCVKVNGMWREESVPFETTLSCSPWAASPLPLG